MVKLSLQRDSNIMIQKEHNTALYDQKLHIFHSESLHVCQFKEIRQNNYYTATVNNKNAYLERHLETYLCYRAFTSTTLILKI